MEKVTQPALGSIIVAGVAPEKDDNGEFKPLAIVLDNTFSPPRIVMEIPDRALRDLGVVTIDGAASSDAGSVYLSGIQYDVKNAVIGTTSGDTTIVLAVTDKKIRVLSLVFTLSSATTVGWSSAGNIKISPMSFAANGGMTFHPTTGFFVETNAGEALVLNQGGGSNIRGTLNYIEV